MSRHEFDGALKGAAADRLAEFEHELARELTIEPSPEFVTRVRMRAAEMAPTRQRLSFLRWSLWVPATIVAIAAVAIVVAMTVNGPAPEREAVVTSLAAPPLPAAAIPPHVVSSPPIGAVTNAAPGNPPRHAEPVAASAHQVEEPEVLVPEGQLNAIRRLMAAISSGQLEASRIGNDAARDSETGNLRELTITPLKIEPLVSPAPPESARER
jgi:hypothetical protein